MMIAPMIAVALLPHQLQSRRWQPAPRMSVSASPARAEAATIIGAGPAGLATAIMLARRGMENIHVYERLPVPAASDDASVWGDTAKFYLIGLGGRGQKALQELGAWEAVKRCSVIVLGRKDWAPGAGVDDGVERIFGDDRPYKTTVIPRDRLAGVLREVALDSYGEPYCSQRSHTKCSPTARLQCRSSCPEPKPKPEPTPEPSLRLFRRLTRRGDHAALRRRADLGALGV